MTSWLVRLSSFKFQVSSFKFINSAVPEGFFSLGATELLLFLTDSPRCWRARRPLASKEVKVSMTTGAAKIHLQKDYDKNNIKLLLTEG